MRKTFLYKYLILVFLVLLGVFNKNTKTTVDAPRVDSSQHNQYASQITALAKSAALVK